MESQDGFYTTNETALEHAKIAYAMLQSALNELSLWEYETGMSYPYNPDDWADDTLEMVGDRLMAITVGECPADDDDVQPTVKVVKSVPQSETYLDDDGKD